MLESDGDVDENGQENVSPEVAAALAAEEVMIEMTKTGPYRAVL